MDPNMLHYLTSAENPHLDVTYYLAVYALLVLMIVCITLGILLQSKDSPTEVRRERLEANPVVQPAGRNREARRRINSIV